MATYNEWLNGKKKECATCSDSIDMLNLKKFMLNIKGLFFPGYVENFSNLEDYLDEKSTAVKLNLKELLGGIEKLTGEKLDKNGICKSFFESLPEVDRLIQTDIQAMFDGDPAAKSTVEIILCYPGFTAIFTYRIAHVLYELKVPVLPRLLTENAHSKTGVDINPGAKIDEYFFIDHGTGIVIGETTEIGKHVKLYQGVTLGALSLSKGHDLIDVKRHPTIRDNVTIYSGASIFGGNTVIGENTTIGSSTFITESVPANSVVTLAGITPKKQRGE
ncbi:MAG: serine O-acetyltransferase [Acholeplasmatales bacterium]|nr:serine O-acetyltransferase [Acholeplasmatales bacterium]